MDNARIHHGDAFLELVDQFGKAFISKYPPPFTLMSFLGVRIEYLPPYSPDLNPIEEAFSKVKHFLRRHHQYYSDAEGDGMLFDMLEVLDIITPDDATSYFSHAGYF